MFTENTTIGILGGGQLGKMVLDVSNRWGLKIFILDPDVNCPFLVNYVQSFLEVT
ncbi:MAG: hypothetical protein ACJ0ON_02555 [Candidatus Marisimplicoccus sp.]